MVLYPGDYSGILKPWQHYVPLEKDHSNMPEVAGAIQDRQTWERITGQAREEIALNPKYSFRALVEKVDDGLALSSRNVFLSPDEHRQRTDASELFRAIGFEGLQAPQNDAAARVWALSRHQPRSAHGRPGGAGRQA